MVTKFLLGYLYSKNITCLYSLLPFVIAKLLNFIPTVDGGNSNGLKTAAKHLSFWSSYIFYMPN